MPRKLPPGNHGLSFWEDTMDTDILREFVSLYETCSFQDTADELNISQSALTKHIHKLESELHVSLFDRSTRSVKRNEYGKEFYPYAREIVQLSDQGLAAMQKVSLRKDNVVRVSFTPATSHYGLIDVLSYFIKRHPDINLEFNEEARVVEVLESGECDFAFAVENESLDDRFEKTVFEKDHLVIVVPKDHPLAAKSAVSIDDIRSEPFVIHTNSSGVPHREDRLIADMFRQKGLQQTIAAKASFTSTVIKIVEHKGCIAALPLNRIPDQNKGIRTLDFVPAVETTMYMVWLKNKKIRGAAGTFLDFIRENEEA